MVQVVVAGVGMVPFAKPGKSETYVQMGEQAARLALDDAAVAYAGVQQAYAGYVYGDSTCGQAALYGLGLTGIPIVNVNNNCSTGSSALFLARQAVASGQLDCVLALGFEQMVPGALGVAFPDRVEPAVPPRGGASARSRASIRSRRPRPSCSAGRARPTATSTASTRRVFAHISVKARRHAAQQPVRRLP